MKLAVSLLTLLVLASASVFGQKIKYKDLFVLLDSKQYNDAEPFLRKYLKENADNPNAQLFMGFILQEKCFKADVLKEADKVAVNADSAVIYYNLAHTAITEKEIKRNDEYYQSYSRRDQRTGEYGIKMSDIHLDIEKRIGEVKDRKEKVQSLRSQFVAWERLYQKSASEFKAIQEAFPGEKEFLLQSDDKSVAALKLIKTNFDSCTMMFAAYKNTLSHLGKTKYNQQFEAKKIVKFKEDGKGLPDFYSDDLKVWNYDEWASAALDEIQNEVVPFREKLVAYDVEINKLFDKIKKDSTSVTKDLPAVEQKVRTNPVARFDASPMPLMLFHMKIEELRFTSSHIDNRKQRDSASFAVRLEAIKSELKTLNKLDSVAGILAAKDIEKETANYQHFVTNAYGSTNTLKSLISATKEFSEHEKHKREDVVVSLSNSLNWLVIDKDSIALGSVKQKRPNHFPLMTAAEKFTSGVKYGADSLATGFFYTITPNRVPDVKVSFTVDKVNFAKRNLPVLKGLAAGNETGDVYYSLIYSETKEKDKFPVTIAKISKPTGLVWTSNYKFDFLPSELIVSPDTGELAVKITAPGGESKLINLDKNGKQL
ncbi:MAG TPA: hypothetical protein VFE50_16110 [Cyclobacteriaceae bacterium]|nr:hypothetical protein [Cyclobacteriaceae bacterium]